MSRIREFLFGKMIDDKVHQAFNVLGGLSKSRVYGLDASKYYLIVFDRASLTMDDASNLLAKLSDDGITSIGIGLKGPANEIKVIETPGPGSSINLAHEVKS